MKEVLHLPIGESVEVISNQVGSETVKNLLLDIIEHTNEADFAENDFSDLDWVKSMLK